ncbi:MAG TPA: universal stress protein [Terriglobales bacterium]|nr:universal stress protein [Terriglobales bacterium]
MRVLLAIDSSSPSQNVIHVASRRPWPFGTTFCVLSIVDMNSWEGLPALIEDAKREAQRLVDRAADQLTQGGSEVFREIQLGLPKKAIPEFARQWGADLVMVGSHGQNQMVRFLLGSVAFAVVRGSPCSVEIVRPSAVDSGSSSHAMRILMATDGSECSTKAVYSVANRPWPPQSQIRIMSVVQLVNPENRLPPAPLGSEYPTSLLEELWNRARLRADDAAAEARKILVGMNLNVYDGPATPVGDPRTIVLDEAKTWAANLIVVGSHGRQGLERLLMGSVSEAIAIHAHCSVEVIRR